MFFKCCPMELVSEKSIVSLHEIYIYRYRERDREKMKEIYWYRLIYRQIKRNKGRKEGEID